MDVGTTIVLIAIVFVAVLLIMTVIIDESLMQIRDAILFLGEKKTGKEIEK